MSNDRIRLYYPTTLELAATIKRQPMMLPTVKSWLEPEDRERNPEVQFHEDFQSARQDELVVLGWNRGKDMCVLVVDVLTMDFLRMQNKQWLARFSIGSNAPVNRRVIVHPPGVEWMSRLLQNSRHSIRATVDYIFLAPVESASREISTADRPISGKPN